jgi:S1-C subfamily serine protease
MLLILPFSCEQKPPEPPDPTELYNKYRKSVVLIQSTYYFKTTLYKGFEFFYTFENEEPVIYENENEAIEKAVITSGTGFFISNQGEIATNRHVVFPTVNEERLSYKINAMIDDVRNKLNELIHDTEYEQIKLADYLDEYFNYLDGTKKTELIDEYNKKT